jgi:hypothetical protein
MSKFKGTKGEWEVSDIFPDTSESLDVKSNCVGVKCNKIAVAICGEMKSYEAQSNAKLIAAAPELLEEHQMDLKHLKNWRNKLIEAGLRGDTMFQEYEDMIFAKEKAINKALGK